MTPTTRSRWNWPAWILAAVVLCLLGTQTHAVRRMLGAPSSVATVDIVRCFNALDERSALETALNERIRAMTEESKATEQQINTRKLDLQDLAPGTPKYRDLENELLQLSYRLKTQVDYTLLYQERRFSEIVLKLYRSIRESAERLARAQGIDIVFVDDTKVEIQPGSEQDITRQISARRMLWVNPGIDVTDDLIRLMNQQFQVANQGPQPRGN